MTDNDASVWRSRTILLYGDDGAERIASSSVLVAGLGAVGSAAVEALARSGVGSLTLVDFDVVEPSNVNRQLCALRSTIGRPKSEIVASRVADINPSCRVVAVRDRIPADLVAARAFLASLPRPDAIIDAIDDVEAKAALISAALADGIPIISSMGAARRFDPTKVRIGTLGEVAGCPLAKALRRSLRAKIADAEESGSAPTIPDPSGVTCVYSVEPPAKQPSVRVDEPRAMGSSMCVTATFGMSAAYAAIGRLFAD